jgi:hypothetical protein
LKFEMKSFINKNKIKEIKLSALSNSMQDHIFKAQNSEVNNV